MNNKLTIVTLTFNNFEELKATLESCKNIPETENLVINGGSCEKTVVYLNEYNVRHISEKDNGIADAFNKGILNSKTKYIMFLNSGDLLIDKEYITNAIKKLDSSDDIGYTHSKLRFKDPVAGEIILSPKLGNIGEGMPFMHPTMIHKKSIYESIGNFNQKYKIAMDYDLAVRVIKDKIQGHYLDSIPVLMDGLGVSTSKEADAIKECKESLLSHGLFHGDVKNSFSKRLYKFKTRELIGKLSPPLLAWIKQKLN